MIALGIVGTAAAYFLFGGASGSKSSKEPFDAVPSDAFLVATVDLAELRRSPIYEVLLGGKESRKPGVLDPRELGMGRLADACGFDPLSRVEKLAVAIPEEGDKGELGVAARGNVTTDELSRCTGALADKRGGKVESKEIGSFVVVEDASSDAPARPKLAFGNGLLVAGRGTWFDAMLATADGKKKGARDAPAHAAMRTSLTSRAGWATPSVVVTALLPRSLRDRLKNEMSGEAKDQGANVMAGVLGVSAIGVALRAGGGGQSTDAAIELVCDTDDGCASVEKLILKKRLEWSKELMLRMVGFGPLLDSIDVKREPLRIRVTAGAPADALATTLDRVLRLRGGGGDRHPNEKSAPPPHETIPAPRP
jgi:hypothetical protein